MADFRRDIFRDRVTVIKFLASLNGYEKNALAKALTGLGIKGYSDSFDKLEEYNPRFDADDEQVAYPNPCAEIYLADPQKTSVLEKKENLLPHEIAQFRDGSQFKDGDVAIRLRERLLPTAVSRFPEGTKAGEMSVIVAKTGGGFEVNQLTSSKHREIFPAAIRAHDIKGETTKWGGLTKSRYNEMTGNPDDLLMKYVEKWTK